MHTIEKFQLVICDQDLLISLSWYVKKTGVRYTCNTIILFVSSNFFREAFFFVRIPFQIFLGDSTQKTYAAPFNEPRQKKIIVV